MKVKFLFLGVFESLEYPIFGEKKQYEKFKINDDNSNDEFNDNSIFWTKFI